MAHAVAKLDDVKILRRGDQGHDRNSFRYGALQEAISVTEHSAAAAILWFSLTPQVCTRLKRTDCIGPGPSPLAARGIACALAACPAGSSCRDLGLRTTLGVASVTPRTRGTFPIISGDDAYSGLWM